MKWSPILLAFLALGCDQLQKSSTSKGANTAVPSVAVQAAETLRLTRADFLSKELIYLGPHLRMGTALRVNIDSTISGKPTLFHSTERWANGKLLPDHGSWSGGPAEGSGSLSVSWKTTEDKKGLLKFEQVVSTQEQNGSSGETRHFEIPYQTSDEIIGGYIKEQKESYDLPANTEYAVASHFWMTIKKANEISHRFDQYSHEDLAKMSEWAVILKVKWKPWP